MRSFTRRHGLGGASARRNVTANHGPDVRLQGCQHTLYASYPRLPLDYLSGGAMQSSFLGDQLTAN